MSELYAGWEDEAAPVQSPSPTYRSSADGRLVSLSMPSPGVTAEAFLALAEGQERFFWEDVRDDILFAGFGVAAHLLAWGPERFAHVEAQARALFADALLLGPANRLAAPRLFGGFAFRDDFMPDNTWSVFHAAHFLLPHFQLVQAGDESWLTINALLPPEERDSGETLRDELSAALQARYDWLCDAARQERPAATLGASAPPLEVNYPMSYEAWAAMIQEAIRQIETTPLQKVVLARVAELRFRERIDVNGALAYLDRHYPDSYRFLFEPRPHHAFYGATPELLVRVSGQTLTTMAMAGSIRRSADPIEDAALGQALLNSAKDRHEHDLVVMSLLERLAPLTKLEIRLAGRLQDRQHPAPAHAGARAAAGGVGRAARGGGAASHAGPGRQAARAGDGLHPAGRAGAARLVCGASGLDRRAHGRRLCRGYPLGYCPGAARLALRRGGHRRRLRAGQGVGGDGVEVPADAGGAGGGGKP